MNKLWRNTIAAFLAVLLATAYGAANARVFRQALPGYQYAFPHDHGSHDQFKTEWWYYTGHLTTRQGQRYGYELTFFRTGVDDPGESGTRWEIKNFYIAHFALSDEQNHKFQFFEKMNRPGAKTADARSDRYRVFNGTWSIEQKDDAYELQADAPDVTLHLTLKSDKPPVVHGSNGVSQKASCKGCASHYYSLTRLKSDGTLTVGRQSMPVTGWSWMDHEFGSNQLTAEQVGWDWYSLQLDDQTELMIYVMRKADGSLDPNSSGSFVRADGSVKHLTLKDFAIKSLSSWKSPKTGGLYPMGWKIDLPSEKLVLTITPAFEDQELNTKLTTGVTYWEGASTVSGTRDNQKIGGQAYVEMTGYAEKFRKNI